MNGERSMRPDGNWMSQGVSYIGETSTFREFPKLASEQHNQVLLFRIRNTELATNLACEKIGDFYMSWDGGNAAWIGEIDILAMF